MDEILPHLVRFSQGLLPQLSFQLGQISRSDISLLRKILEMYGELRNIVKPSSFLLRRVLYQKFHTSILSVWGFDNLPPSVVAGISLCIPDL